MNAWLSHIHDIQVIHIAEAVLQLILPSHVYRYELIEVDHDVASDKQR